MNDPGPHVLVTGMTDRRSVRRTVQASLTAARVALSVAEHDPLAAPDDPASAVLELVVATAFGEPASERALEGARSRLARARRVVLDADDPASRRLGAELAAPVTWTTRDARNPLVLDHLDRGGDACLFEAGALRLAAGGTHHTVCEARALPALLGGIARRPLGAALAALGASVALGLPLTAARSGLAMLEGPRYARRHGVQVLLDHPADAGAVEESLRTLCELPAERRLLWRALPGLEPVADALAPGIGVEVWVEVTLRELLRSLRPGDALLVLVPEDDREVAPLVDRFESGRGA